MADAVTHVVLGTGPVGLSVAEVLAQAGLRVRLVNRSGRVGEALPDGVEVAAADVVGAVDWATLAGSIGLFLTLFFLFLRIMPIVSLAEMREIIHKEGGG